jgi:hypothetical protein
VNEYYEKYVKDYQRSPKGKYIVQRSNAAKRNIPWEFTFESWWKIWEDSGKWEQRGNRRGQYVMSRHDDYGPYSPENVEIKLIEDNSKESADRLHKKTMKINDWEPTERKSAWDYQWTEDNWNKGK